MTEATFYTLKTDGFVRPALIKRAHDGWAAHISGVVENGALRFVGRPCDAVPALTVVFSTFESAGAAYEFVRLLGSDQRNPPRISLDRTPKAKHEVVFPMEDRTDPVSAMRVATSLLYEAEGCRSFDAITSIVRSLHEEPVRSDPSDGTEYRQTFATAVSRRGLPTPSDAPSAPSGDLAPPDGLPIASRFRIDCGVSHKIDEVSGSPGPYDVKSYVVIPTVDSSASDNARLRQAMVAMMRPPRGR